MIAYRESDVGAKILAKHYAEKLNSPLFTAFITAQSDLKSNDEAEEVIVQFWKMVNLSIEDNYNGNTLQGAEDIEFWMHKLFNKVSGYMEKNGYEALWDEHFQR